LYGLNFVSRMFTVENDDVDEMLAGDVADELMKDEFLKMGAKVESFNDEIEFLGASQRIDAVIDLTNDDEEKQEFERILQSVSAKKNFQPLPMNFNSNYQNESYGFVNHNLQNQNLQNQNYPNQSFQNQNVQHQHFQSQNFVNPNFQNQNIQNQNFQNQNFQNQNFLNQNFQNQNVQDQNFQNQNFQSQNFQNQNFQNQTNSAPPIPFRQPLSNFPHINFQPNTQQFQYSQNSQQAPPQTTTPQLNSNQVPEKVPEITNSTDSMENNVSLGSFFMDSLLEDTPPETIIDTARFQTDLKQNNETVNLSLKSDFFDEFMSENFGEQN